MRTEKIFLTPGTADPFANDTLYATAIGAPKTVTKNINGLDTTFSRYKYSLPVGLLTRIITLIGLAVFTVFTGFATLCFQGVRSLWEKALKGKEIFAIYQQGPNNGLGGSGLHESATDLMRQGFEREMQGDFDGAEKLFKKAHSKNPNEALTCVQQEKPGLLQRITNIFSSNAPKQCGNCV